MPICKHRCLLRFVCDVMLFLILLTRFLLVAHFVESKQLHTQTANAGFMISVTEMSILQIH